MVNENNYNIDNDDDNRNSTEALGKEEQYIIVVTGFSYVSSFISLCTSAYDIFYQIPFTRILTSYLLAPCYVIFALSILFPMVASLGCSSAVRGNLRCLKWWNRIIVFIFVCTFVGGIYGCSSSGYNAYYKHSTFKEALFKYNRDSSVKEVIDNMQQKFECCGINGVQDWNTNELVSCNFSKILNETRDLPQSCCAKNELTDDENITTNHSFHSNGCLKEIDFVILTITTKIALASFIQAVCQVFFYSMAKLLINRGLRNLPTREMSLDSGFGE